jgi:translation elongation factor EF-4
MVKVVLITPETYYGAMMDIVKERRGTDIITQFLDDGQVVCVIGRVCVIGGGCVCTSV